MGIKQMCKTSKLQRKDLTKSTFANNIRPLVSSDRECNRIDVVGDGVADQDRIRLDPTESVLDCTLSAIATETSRYSFRRINDMFRRVCVWSAK